MKQMRPLKKKVSITIDSDIDVEIRKLADEDDRTFSQYINRVLKEWTKRKNEFDSESKNQVS